MVKVGGLFYARFKSYPTPRITYLGLLLKGLKMGVGAMMNSIVILCAKEVFLKLLISVIFYFLGSWRGKSDDNTTDESIKKHTFKSGCKHKLTMCKSVNGDSLIYELYKLPFWLQAIAALF